jgi:putative transposase
MYGGYNEIQNPRQWYSLINRHKLTALLDIKYNDQLSAYHRNWIEAVLKSGLSQRDAKWTESIAVGDKEFVMKTQSQTGCKSNGPESIGEQ